MKENPQDADDVAIHVVVQFVGGVARTRCGDYANADKVTAFRDQATCPKCGHSDGPGAQE